MVQVKAVRKPAPTPAVRSHRGYGAQLVTFCQQFHRLRHLAALSELLVEPRFLIAQPMVAPLDENLTKSSFYNVPMVTDYPALHAPYFMPTHSIEDLGEGAAHLALIGIPGSGRTTALQTIALWCMGAVRFSMPADVIQERLANEEKALNPEQRAERVKNRVLMAQQTRERLAENQGKSYVDSLTDEGTRATRIPALRNLAPFYIHAAALVIGDKGYGRVADPAEPFVRALQSQSGYVVAQTLPRTVYQLISAGKALLLIDGLDALTPDDYARTCDWLKALIATYPGNRVIVADIPDGTLALEAIGLVPVQLAPWHERDIRRFLEMLAPLLAKIGRTLPVGDPLKEFIRRARLSTVTQIVQELIAPTDTHAERALELLRLRFAGADAAQADLRILAGLQLEKTTVAIDDALKSLMMVAPAVEGDKDPVKRSVSKRLEALLGNLHQAGIIMRLPRERFVFNHADIVAALVAPTLTEETLAQHLHDPLWETVTSFAHETHPLESLVSRLLEQRPDVALTSLLRPARWLRYAPKDAAWRVPYLRLLATWLIPTHQYSVTRERVAAALLTSGDDTILNAFRKMIQSGAPDARRIGVLALGALRDTDAIAPLANIALTDVETSVRVAATLALGAIGSDSAVQTLVGILDRVDNADVQRAAAESLASLPERGYPALYDAILSPSLTVRRAAVWGLGRILTDWALVLLNETYVTDEWYVQSAVMQVFIDVYESGSRGVYTYPAIDDIEWLQTWYKKSVKLSIVPAALAEQALMLTAMAQNDDLAVRLMSLALAGQLGDLWTLETLYKALYDNEEAIRDSAYRSLVELSRGWRLALPGVV